MSELCAEGFFISFEGMLLYPVCLSLKGYFKCTIWTKMLGFFYLFLKNIFTVLCFWNNLESIFCFHRRQADTFLISEWDAEDEDVWWCCFYAATRKQKIRDVSWGIWNILMVTRSSLVFSLRPKHDQNTKRETKNHVAWNHPYIFMIWIHEAIFWSPVHNKYILSVNTFGTVGENCIYI